MPTIHLEPPQGQRVKLRLESQQTAVLMPHLFAVFHKARFELDSLSKRQCKPAAAPEPIRVFLPLDMWEVVRVVFD